MNAPDVTTYPQRPFVAGFWLVAAIPASIIAVIPLAVLTEFDMDEPIGLSALLLTHFLCGYLWSRSLSRRAGRSDSRLMNVAAGIGFTFFVWGGRAAIVELDSTIPHWSTLLQGKIHFEFAAIFVLWTGIVTGGTGLALGLGAIDWKLSLRLLLLGFVSGGATFLIVAFFMDMFGFRVGTPRPDGIPSMVITTLLGIWSTALVGSAIFGKELMKYGRSRDMLTCQKEKPGTSRQSPHTEYSIFSIQSAPSKSHNPGCDAF